jgi:hypothetical protein
LPCLLPSPNNAFSFKNVSCLVLERFRFFKKHAQNLNTPQNNLGSWDLQMGFNSAFKGLSYQDSQQHRACSSPKSTNTETQPHPTNIKVVGQVAKYKNQIDFLKLFLVSIYSYLMYIFWHFLWLNSPTGLRPPHSQGFT